MAQTLRKTEERIKGATGLNLFVRSWRPVIELINGHYNGQAQTDYVPKLWEGTACPIARRP
jgi:hypothetical protein